MVYPNGLVSEFTCNAQGLVETKTETPPAGSPGHVRVTRMSYDAAGQPTEVQTPDGVIVQTAYDRKGRVIVLSDNLNQRMSYQYDAANNVIQSDHFNADGTLALNQRNLYDARNRLERLLLPHDGAQDAATQWCYDGNHNVLSVIEPRGNTTSQRYDSEDRLIESTHHLNGTTRHTYDTNNRLTEGHRTERCNHPIYLRCVGMASKRDQLRSRNNDVRV